MKQECRRTLRTEVCKSELAPRPSSVPPLVKIALMFLAISTAGCADTTAPDLGGMPVFDVDVPGSIGISARSAMVNDTVSVFVDFQNTGPDTAVVLSGDPRCSFGVRGVHSSGMTWDNRLPPNSGCADVGYGLIVPPGTTRSEPVYGTTGTDLRAQVLPGSYRITVFIRIAKQLRSYAAGQIGL